MFWSVPNETLCAYGCICVLLHLRQLQVPRNCMSRSLLLNPSVPCCMCASCRMRHFSLFPQIFSERTFFSYVSINFVLKNSVSQRGPQKSKLDSYVEIRTKYVQLFSSTFHQPKNVQKLRRISTRNYGSTIVLWWARKNAMSQRPPSIQKKKRDARSTCPRTRARPKWPRHERASSRNAAPIATASRPM